MKIYADTADLEEMGRLQHVDGFTTNPTLMRAAGVRDYRAFATKALAIAAGRPISFEVTRDDRVFAQARKIASWGLGAVAKVPVVDTQGNSMEAVLRDLSTDGVPLNATAVFTWEQAQMVAEVTRAGSAPVIISVFAGRVADAGHDPYTHVMEIVRGVKKTCPRAQVLWASPRQVYDVVLAEMAGADIITMTPALLGKRGLRGRNLHEFSIETSRMFYSDAQAAGLEL